MEAFLVPIRNPQARNLFGLFVPSRKVINQAGNSAGYCSKPAPFPPLAAAPMAAPAPALPPTMRASRPKDRFLWDWYTGAAARFRLNEMGLCGGFDGFCR